VLQLVKNCDAYNVSFKITQLEAWNTLLPEIQGLTELNTLNWQLKTFLFEKAFTARFFSSR